MTPGSLAVAILKALAEEVGVDGVVKLAAELFGADHVKAILDAEYLATDLAVDVEEIKKLDDISKP